MVAGNFYPSRRTSWDIRGCKASISNITTSIRAADVLRITLAKRITEWNNNVRRASAMHVPPANTRASGRARAVTFFQNCKSPCNQLGLDRVRPAAIFSSWVIPSRLTTTKVDRFCQKPR